MIAVLSLLSLLVFSLIITRVATIALTFTGLSLESAKFQARSAFTGVGFTTSEAEGLVNHPVRRRIVMLLMLLGNVGIVTVVSSAIISLVDVFGGGMHFGRFVVLLLGLSAFVSLARSRWVENKMSQAIAWALRRWTDIDVHDYANLLHLAGEYGISELPVRTDDWMADRSLDALRLRDEGLIVIGIHRGDGSYVGAPIGNTVLITGDTVTVYGRTSRIAALDQRRCDGAGDACHQKGIASYREILIQQREDASPSDGATA